MNLLDALDEWVLHMTALRRSPETIRTYSVSVRQFAAYVGDAVTVDAATPTMIREFLVDVLERAH
jgi:hypothetical protein